MLILLWGLSWVWPTLELLVLSCAIAALTHRASNSAFLKGLVVVFCCANWYFLLLIAGISTELQSIYNREQSTWRLEDAEHTSWLDTEEMLRKSTHPGMGIPVTPVRPTSLRNRAFLCGKNIAQICARPYAAASGFFSGLEKENTRSISTKTRADVVRTLARDYQDSLVYQASFLVCDVREEGVPLVGLASQPPANLAVPSKKFVLTTSPDVLEVKIKVARLSDGTVVLSPSFPCTRPFEVQLFERNSEDYLFIRDPRSSMQNVCFPATLRS